jgi:hypothetical protein
MRHLMININGVRITRERSSRGSWSTRAGVKSICGSIRRSRNALILRGPDLRAPGQAPENLELPCPLRQ